jgi:exodeoxyribonuclease V alpha subunit
MRQGQQELDVLRGQVASVKLLKDSWGRAMVRAGSGDAAVAVMGTVLGIDEGTTVECRGRWDVHPQYGRQFKASTISTIVPSSAEGAIAWIASKLPAVGRKRATELVERYGIPALWDVLERTPEQLVEVRGITAEAAEKIGAEYARVKGERDEMVTLRGWGLSEYQISRCREAWKGTVVAELRADPFRLAEVVEGFGFRRADEVARRMGTPSDHPSRIRACLMHTLSEAEGAGHCYVVSGALVAIASDTLGLARDIVARELGRAVGLGVVIQEGSRVYLATTHRAEQGVARRALAMLGARGGAEQRRAA